MVYLILRRFLAPIIKFWIKEANGIGNIPKDRNFIIAANHTSYMDHLIIGAIFIKHLNKKIHFLSKKEHFDNVFKRAWHTYAGAIPIDRRNGKDAIEKAVKSLLEGKIIAIHPEGTRSLDGKLQKAKTGIARIALQSKIQVVPVGLIGTFEILPKGKYIPKFKKSIINIGKPIDFTEYNDIIPNKKILNEITTKIMKEIANLSNQKYDFYPGN